jgi:hypothetical protein
VRWKLLHSSSLDTGLAKARVLKHQSDNPKATRQAPCCQLYMGC